MFSRQNAKIPFDLTQRILFLVHNSCSRDRKHGADGEKANYTTLTTMESNDNTATEQVNLFRSICGDGVTEDRIQGLLEAANGSLERAVDLYFHQQSRRQHGGHGAGSMTPTKEKRRLPASKSTPGSHEASPFTPQVQLRSSSTNEGNKKREATPNGTKKTSPAGSMEKKQAKLEHFNFSCSSPYTKRINASRSLFSRKTAVKGVHHADKRKSSQSPIRSSSPDNATSTTSGIAMVPIKVEPQSISVPSTPSSVAEPDSVVPESQPTAPQIPIKQEEEDEIHHMEDSESDTPPSPMDESKSEIVGTEHLPLKKRKRIASFMDNVDGETNSSSPKQLNFSDDVNNDECQNVEDSCSPSQNDIHANLSILEEEPQLYNQPNQALSPSQASHPLPPTKGIQPNEPPSFADLASVLQQMADTTKRLVKLDVLSQFLRDLIELKYCEEDTFRRQSPENGRTNNEDISRVMTCALFLVLGRPSSIYHAPLQVSGSTISKGLQTVLGIKRMQLSKAYRKYGELGDAAASLFQHQNSAKSFFIVRNVPENGTKTPTSRSDNLGIIQVYEKLQLIANETKGRNAKQAIVFSLLRSCKTKSEINFMVRLLACNMRIGASLKTILAALAMAFTSNQSNEDATLSPSSCTISTKDAMALLQKTYDSCPNLELIVTALLEGGWKQLRRDCGIQVLTPISPMLAHPVHSLEEVREWMIARRFTSLKESTATSDGAANGIEESCANLVETDICDNVAQTSATMEWKYDGVRCQAHFNGQELKLFSRHMLETTVQYPEAAKYILEAFKGNNHGETSDENSAPSFILDAEIVGISEIAQGESADHDNQALRPSGDHDYRLLPFQDLVKRKRDNSSSSGPSNTADGADGPVQIKVLGFDLMYFDGQSLLNLDLWQRQEMLREHFQETRGFGVVRSKLLSQFDEDILRAFLEEAVSGGAEGLMIKFLGSSKSRIVPGTSLDGKDGVSKDDSSTIGSILRSPYEAGTRSQSWLKVKRDYVQGYADTIDVVPIGAWYVLLKSHFVAGVDTNAHRFACSAFLVCLLLLKVRKRSEGEKQFLESGLVGCIR